jgi:uncharacterized protein (DUF433 family)
LLLIDRLLRDAIIDVIDKTCKIGVLYSIIETMKPLTRITFNTKVMGGKPCIRGLRVTVGTIVGLIASGYSTADILKLYPYLEPDDLREALSLRVVRIRGFLK